MSKGTRVQVISSTSPHYGKIGTVSMHGKSGFYWVELEGITFPFYANELKAI